LALDYDYDNNEEHLTSEDFLQNERDAKKKAREAKKLRKKYKFSDKKHSALGIISSVFALIALGLIIAAVLLSAKAHGQGGTAVGVTGAASFVSAVCGIICGLIAFRQTDVILRFAWIGLISSIIIWIIDAMLIVLGI